jgi:hypothetical protein
VSLSRDGGYSLEPGDPTAAPHAEPLTTASALPPASCSAARPSVGWFGDSGADADCQVMQGNAFYADVSVMIAPLTPAGEKYLRGYLRKLPSTCYSPHWFSFRDGLNYSDDGGFTRPADGTRLLDMGYGKSGSASYLEYWTVSDGYLLDFLYAPAPASCRRGNQCAALWRRRSDMSTACCTRICGPDGLCGRGSGRRSSRCALMIMSAMFSPGRPMATAARNPAREHTGEPAVSHLASE